MATTKKVTNTGTQYTTVDNQGNTVVTTAKTVPGMRPLITITAADGVSAPTVTVAHAAELATLMQQLASGLIP